MLPNIAKGDAAALADLRAVLNQAILKAQNVLDVSGYSNVDANE